MFAFWNFNFVCQTCNPACTYLVLILSSWNLHRHHSCLMIVLKCWYWAKSEDGLVEENRPSKKGKDLSILDDLKGAGHHKAQLCNQLPLPGTDQHRINPMTRSRLMMMTMKTMVIGNPWWWSLLGHNASSWSWLRGPSGSLNVGVQLLVAFWRFSCVVLCCAQAAWRRE